jgi:hypothetical protein
MGRNLSTLFISSSYQFLTQLSGSELQTGLGTTITGSLLITASRADTATTASYVLNAVSSSFATTASFALNAGTTVSTASLLTTASAAANVITFTKGDGSTFPVTVATGSTVSSSFASTASLALLNVLTASSTNATITYTKGDGTTFTNVINNVVNATSASLATSASQAVSASYVLQAVSASFATSASQAVSASFAVSSSRAVSSSVAISSSYALSSSFATTASFYGGSVVSASFATTASFAQNIASGLSPTFANVTASNVLITGTASVALLYTQTISSSTIYSSGSNQFGDASNDVQTLYGTFNIVNGPSNFTGSVNSLNGYTGSLLGTASFATSASQAQNAVSASFATTASFYGGSVVSASYAVSASQAQNSVSSSYALSSSFATTASFALNVPATSPFPFTGSAVITGSLVITGSITTGFPGNTVSVSNGAIIGGGNGGVNTVSGDNSVVAGGQLGNAIAPNGFIGAGRNNRLSGGERGGIVGGFDGNIASGDGGFIGGGGANTVNANYAGVLAGYVNTVSHARSAIIGGSSITSSAADTVYVPNFYVSGSTEGVVGNNSDTYTSSPRVNQVVTLTQAEYNAIGSPNANTLYIISGSTPASYAVVSGSNTFVGNQVFSGSVRGAVNALTISSTTASLDCSLGNFFTLTLVNAVGTLLNPSNILPGQTINVRISQPATTGSGQITFPSSIKQVSGSAYSPTSGASAQDIITFIAFDTSSLYLSNIKNFV